MKVDVSFKFAKVYNIENIDVVKGQKFSLFTDAEMPIKWFSDNDPAISFVTKNNSVAAQATEIGKSTVLIMNQDFGTIKKLTINVVEEIVEPASDLGLTASEPVLK